MKTTRIRKQLFNADELTARAGNTWKDIRGVKTRVAPSPFDIPEAVVVMDDKDDRLRVVEMRYISDENFRRVGDRKRGVVLRVGERSNRFYGAELDTSILQQRSEYVQAILEALKRAVVDVLEQRRQSYQLVKAALTEAEPLIEGSYTTGEFTAIAEKKVLAGQK